MRFRLPLLAAVAAALALVGGAGARVDPQVAGLQVALHARGLYPGPIDAVEGPLTRRAVLGFQHRAGLEVDGIAGPRTRRALGPLGRHLYGTRVLQAGMVGWDVSVLQYLLGRRAVPTLLDGRFGPRTAAAVRRFQRRAGLGVDGIAGPATRTALASSLARSRRPARAVVRAALVRWSRRYGIDQRLVRALAWVESGFQPTITSPVAAWGVLQVTPDTWRFVETVLVRRRVPHTLEGGVRAGVAYLDHLLARFGENERLALAAYYQGPRAVRARLYPETRHFVATVLALKRRITPV